MAFLMLQGKTRQIEAVVFPEVYQKIKDIQPMTMYQLIGTLQERNQKTQININQMKPIPKL